MSLTRELIAAIPGAKVTTRAGVTTIVVPGGKCRVCGCTDADCWLCIRRTGRPCSWANAERDLCTACVGREKITIRVRGTGGDHFARVLNQKFKASCTSSPEQAARAAAQKFFGERPFELKQSKAGSCASKEPWEFVAREMKAEA